MAGGDRRRRRKKRKKNSEPKKKKKNPSIKCYPSIQPHTLAPTHKLNAVNFFSFPPRRNLKCLEKNDKQNLITNIWLL